VLHFPRWKILAILATCFFFALLAAPNLFSEHARAAFPSFLPSRSVSLGLDLQGGSYLLLELQIDHYVHEQLNATIDSLRSEFVAKKIMYQGLTVTNDVIKFTLLKSSEFTGDMSDIIRKINPELELKKGDNDSYEVSFNKTALKNKQTQLVEQSIQIVNRRINETGTREPIIQRQGDNRIILQVPGLQEPEKLKALLGKTAKMTFHLVDDSVDISELLHGKIVQGTKILYEEARGEKDTVKIPVAIKSRVMLSGDLLIDAAPSFDNQNNEAVVTFRFNSVGAAKFGEITRQNIGKRFAIVLDDKVITAPVIRTAIVDGSGQISGSFTPESANELSVLLRSGALPVPLKVIEERSIGPNLGADSIEAGKKASLLGVVLVVIFMFINYGIFGIFADIGLLVNLIFIMGALSLLQATLTLPGIAGMVLTLGMSVDANVIIYERIREEIRNGKSPFAAVEHGLKVARATIIDANVTTLIAAFLLFYFGTGTVKGFAITLAIGIVSSMFTATVLTRLIIAVWMKRKRPKILPI